MTNQLKHLAAVTIATIAMGSTAVAGSVNFDYRFDYKNTTYNSDHTSAALSGKSDFLAQTGRLDFKGKFSDDVSYRLRYRLNLWTAAATNTRNDNLAANVDLMYLTQKMSDTMTLTVGKFTSDLGGYDGTQSGADIYLASKNWSTIWLGSSYKVGSTTYNLFGAKPFVSGLKGTAMFDNHELNIFVANSQEGGASTGASGAPSAQTRMTSGATFKGSFMDKALTPYFSYALEKANDGTASAKKDMDTKYTYMTIGLKYDMNDWFVALDNSIFSADKMTVATDGVWTQNSMVINAGYTMDKMTYKLMYDTTAEKFAPVSGTEGKLTTTGISGAAEYRPTTDKNFRYHVAYTTQSSKADTTGATTSTETNLIAGVRLNADFLK